MGWFTMLLVLLQERGVSRSGRFSTALWCPFSLYPRGRIECRLVGYALCQSRRSIFRWPNPLLRGNREQDNVVGAGSKSERQHPCGMSGSRYHYCRSLLGTGRWAYNSRRKWNSRWCSASAEMPRACTRKPLLLSSRLDARENELQSSGIDWPDKEHG